MRRKYIARILCVSFSVGAVRYTGHDSLPLTDEPTLFDSSSQDECYSLYDDATLFTQKAPTDSKDAEDLTASEVPTSDNNATSSTTTTTTTSTTTSTSTTSHPDRYDGGLSDEDSVRCIFRARNGCLLYLIE